MDLNNYSNVISNVANINNSVLNAENLKQQAKEKIPDMIGDILTAEGSRELLGKVLSPLAKRALTKIGMAKEDVEDLGNGKFTKVALRKIKQKLGRKTQQEAEQEQDQREADRVQEPSQEEQRPTPGADEEPVEAPTSEGQTLGDALDDPELFESYARSTYPEFADAPSSFIEEARGQLQNMADLDLEQPLGDLATRLAPGYRVLADVNAPQTEAGQNVAELAETDENPLSLQTPRSLGTQIVRREPQQAGQELHGNENTSGASQELSNENGGSVGNSASEATGSSSGSGDASLSSVAEDAATTAGEDAGLATTESTLAETAAATAELPGIGEVIAPLLAIGAGLAAIFGHGHKHSSPVLNPSYQFL